MDFQNELDTLLRSRFTLICVVSPGEERVIGLIEAVCSRGRRPLAVWDHADLFRSPGSGFEPLKAGIPRRGWDVDLVTAERKQIIQESGAPEFHEVTETPTDGAVATPASSTPPLEVAAVPEPPVPDSSPVTRAPCRRCGAELTSSDRFCTRSKVHGL